MSHSETDLRAALAELALDDGVEPDVTDLRARLIAADPTGATADQTSDPDVADVVDLDAVALAPRRAHSRRAVFLVAAAAIVAAIVGLAVAVLPAGEPEPVSPADALRDLGGQQFPGTEAVAFFRGRGPRTLPVPADPVPTGFQLSVKFACDGTGTMAVNGASTPDCRGGSTVGTNVPAGQRILRIETGPRVSWRLVFAHEPLTRTNGSVISPVDFSFDRATAAGLTRGRGNGATSATSDAGTYTVQVVCRGTGVRLPKVVSDEPGSATGATGAVTATCFRGFMYQWQDVRLDAGQELRVVAAAGTTWQVLISRR